MKIARPRFKPGDIVCALGKWITDDLRLEILHPIRYELTSPNRWQWFYEAKNTKNGEIIRIGERHVYTIRAKKKGKK